MHVTRMSPFIRVTVSHLFTRVSRGVTPIRAFIVTNHRHISGIFGKPGLIPHVRSGLCTRRVFDLTQFSPIALNHVTLIQAQTSSELKLTVSYCGSSTRGGVPFPAPQV